MKFSVLAATAALFFLLVGCASYSDLPPGTVKQVCPSPVIQKEEVIVESPLRDEAPPHQYFVGQGDVLFIDVSGKPGMGSPRGDTYVAGSRVDSDGFIQLPLVGRIQVGGLSVSEIQDTLKRVYARYLNKPWVVVEISQYGSKPVYLLGQFRTPGTYFMDRPLTLLQGMALGDGVLDTANLRNARLIRNGKIASVDIFRLLTMGNLEQNVWLKPKDILFVPDDKNQNVFVFGAVQNPGPVPMPNGRLSLTQALASAGLDGAGDNEEHIRLIRSLSPTQGELIVLDLRSILRGESLPFPLMEGDILYVPRSAVGNWNQALRELLPTLQTFSAILQPFVQIEFLQED